MNKFYTNKIEDICEIYKLLEIYNILMLTQSETENLNNSITIKEIELKKTRVGEDVKKREASYALGGSAN